MGRYLKFIYSPCNRIRTRRGESNWIQLFDKRSRRRERRGDSQGAFSFAVCSYSFCLRFCLLEEWASTINGYSGCYTCIPLFIILLHVKIKQLKSGNGWLAGIGNSQMRFYFTRLLLLLVLQKKMKMFYVKVRPGTIQRDTYPPNSSSFTLLLVSPLLATASSPTWNSEHVKNQ